jgi:hypothetical protein
VNIHARWRTPYGLFCYEPVTEMIEDQEAISLNLVIRNWYIRKNVTDATMKQVENGAENHNICLEIFLSKCRRHIQMLLT